MRVRLPDMNRQQNVYPDCLNCPAEQPGLISDFVLPEDFTERREEIDEEGFQRSCIKKRGKLQTR